ncbi:uncharacterized kinase-like protein D1044.1 isoform X2 [Panulirus ornatus]
MLRNIGAPNKENMMTPTFIKEGTCFSEILPAIKKVMNKLGGPEIQVPKVYYCSYEKGKEVLLLEDLRAQNFKMFDRKRGMDAPHARLVFRELGKLHAASLLLERTLPNHDIAKTWNIFKNPWMDDEYAKRAVQDITGSQLEGAAAIIEKVPNYEHVAPWIRENKDNAIYTFVENHANTHPNMVFIHGDCWTNNILFRYNDAGDPVEVMLVDLQVMRKSAPAVDLNYFLYTSFNGPERKLNLEEFLKTYYTSFSSVLEAGHEPVPFTLQELKHDFRRNMKFGCIAGMLAIPFVLSEAADVISMEDITEDNLEEITKDRVKTIVNMSQREDGLLKPRLLDMIDEMLEAGVIRR